MKKAFKVMNELRSQNLLCDVTIVAEDMEISAHRVVLAACSPYFHAMFTGTSPSSWCEFLESQLHPVNCLGIRAFADMHACTDLLNKANTYAGGEAEDGLREPETEKALSSSLHAPWTSAGLDHAALPGPLLLPVH
ncbi:kelch-like protein 2 isoform X2 [Pan troglodytes]|uniref:kelch-like protein 2 isoform X2 n=1 Tax=Pan troglodytes TaxID=9598 RepID=UPI0030141976